MLAGKALQPHKSPASWLIQFQRQQIQFYCVPMSHSHLFCTKQPKKCKSAYTIYSRCAVTHYPLVNQVVVVVTSMTQKVTTPHERANTLGKLEDCMWEQILAELVVTGKRSTQSKQTMSFHCAPHWCSFFTITAPSCWSYCKATSRWMLLTCMAQICISQDSQQVLPGFSPQKRCRKDFQCQNYCKHWIFDKRKIAYM